MLLMALILLLVVPLQTIPQFTDYKIALSPDGSAEWVVEYRYPVREGDEHFFRMAVDRLNETAAGYADRIRTVVAEASNLIGREMAVEGFTVDARLVETLSGNVAIITLKFKWMDFATVTQDGEVRVGDVFVGGLFLLEGERLRIEYPAKMSISEVRPPPDSLGPGYVEWVGKRSFSDGEPKLILKPGETAISDGWAAGGVAVILAGAGVSGAVTAFVLGKRLVKRPAGHGDVQKVLEIIRRHGGSVPQSEIVRESGLPKSTVSAVLKYLEDEGKVVRTRVGREKNVKLAR
ncbi:MAG: MarR family transcriptional regulator [Nitrososphaerota archaeon]